MKKKKPIIGILATSNYMLTNDTFQDTYRYGNNYIKKIVENGGIPFLIPYVDEEIILESLAMCDGLLLPGGDRVRPVAFEVIDYFYKARKPIFGICLGMQTLAMYSVNKENKKQRIIKPIVIKESHWPFDLVRENNTMLAHKDFVKKDSFLYSLLKEEEIMVNSVHKNTVTCVGNLFRVSITSFDGLIEGIESALDNQFVIGVQFHPEILPEFNILFEAFIKECQEVRD